MTIINQYADNNSATRLSSIKQANRRCIQKIQVMRSSVTSTVVVTALPALITNR